jgi:hypothetical protein
LAPRESDRFASSLESELKKSSETEKSLGCVFLVVVLLFLSNELLRERVGVGKGNCFDSD